MEQLSGIIVSVLSLAGIVGWIQLGIRARQGIPPLPYEPRPEIRWPVGVLVIAGGWIIWLTTSVLVNSFARWNGEVQPRTLTLEIVQQSCLMNIVILGLLILLLTEGRLQRLADFGISRKHWQRNVLTGIYGLVLAFPAVLLVQVLMKDFRNDENMHSMLKLLNDDPGLETRLWIALAVIVLAPLTEELLFRVILQGVLRTRFKAWPSIVISSVIFSAMHGFPDAVGLLPLAVIFGYIYERTHSYVAVVVTHAAFNELNYLLALMAAGG
ncbi:MAG: hypothetical protein Tsb009_15890 [Planctomycetaceae bacterium]